MAVQWRLPPKSISSSSKVKSFQNKGDVSQLPKKIKQFIQYSIDVCTPGGVFLCDGTDGEIDQVVGPWVQAHIVTKLGNDRSSFLFRTDPRDTGEIKKTYCCTANHTEYMPSCLEKAGAGERCGDLTKTYNEIKAEADVDFTKCMKGRTMFVIPFTLGLRAPQGCNFGVLVTDSPFAYMAVRMQLRIPPQAWTTIGAEQDSFIKCLHSVGCPRPVKVFVRQHWACNPDQSFLVHHLEDKRIKSFGSGFLNPSSFLLPLLMDNSNITTGKVIASTFSILSILTPHGKEFFVALASASDREAIELAETTPSLPGYIIKLIACGGLTFISIDSEGVLRASNPAIGFSGHGVGCNSDNCPALLQSLRTKSLLLNAAVTSDSQFYWEGMFSEMTEQAALTNWKGLPYINPPSHESDIPSSSPNAAHPKCRYFCHYARYPCIRPGWDSCEGFPLSAIVFSCRRGPDIPLVCELKSWTHGIAAGACLRSDNTVNVELGQGQPLPSPPRQQQQKQQQQKHQKQRQHQTPQHKRVLTHQQENKSSIHREPMGMPETLLSGPSMGKYLGQWLNLEHRLTTAPRLYRVNWWSRPQEDQNGEGSNPPWPGQADNIRILDWILRRCDGHRLISLQSPIGVLPLPGTVNMTGLDNIDIKSLLSVRKQFWLREIEDDKKILKSMCGESTPFTFNRFFKDLQEEYQSHLLEDDHVVSHCLKPTVDRCYTCLGPVPKKDII